MLHWWQVAFFFSFLFFAPALLQSSPIISDQCNCPHWPATAAAHYCAITAYWPSSNSNSRTAAELQWLMAAVQSSFQPRKRKSKRRKREREQIIAAHWFALIWFTYHHQQQQQQQKSSSLSVCLVSFFVSVCVWVMSQFARHSAGAAAAAAVAAATNASQCVCVSVFLPVQSGSAKIQSTRPHTHSISAPHWFACQCWGKQIMVRSDEGVIVRVVAGVVVVIVSSALLQ